MKRVLAAMSGGVDSSVAAYLLKDSGYEVIGVTMDLWSGDPGTENTCCSLSSVEDARRVANRIGIRHYTLNMKRPFKEKVIDDFVREYRSGRTPNPCVRCNQYLKFDVLLKKAAELGADHIATGHYAVIGKRVGRFILKKGRDPRKDQSYFLYPLKQKALSRALFPVGGLTKAQTRKIAAKLGLSVAEKKESQEACFVEGGDCGEFVNRRLPLKAKPGPILSLSGKVLGRHKGIVFYTIGQRRGLGIGGEGPYYVVSIDKEKNAVIVGKDSDLLGRELILKEVNLISVGRISSPIEVRTKIRYNAKECASVVSSLGRGRIKIHFSRPVRAITPGQSAVFYDGDVVVGGGIISERVF